MKYTNEKLFFPDFPRTKHFPIDPNATSDDLIASVEEVKQFFKYSCSVSEKVDGANCGIAFVNGEPMIRNRTKILNKSYQAKGKAKEQFSPIFTWFYQNQDKLKKLNKILGFETCVYGEWLYAKHAIFYDAIPDWFVAFDIYNPYEKFFLSPWIANKLFDEVGFSHPKEICSMSGDHINIEDFVGCRLGKSSFSTNENMEGCYVKFADEERVVARYKMVNSNFKSDDDWTKTKLIKNVRK